MKRNLCTKKVDEKVEEARLSKQIWHYDDGDCRCLCGSPAKKSTSNPFSVNCDKCNEIIAKRRKVLDIFRPASDNQRGQYCSYCGAKHRSVPYRIYMAKANLSLEFSLCKYCWKMLLESIRSGNGIQM